MITSRAPQHCGGEHEEEKQNWKSVLGCPQESAPGREGVEDPGTKGMAQPSIQMAA